MAFIVDNIDNFGGEMSKNNDEILLGILFILAWLILPTGDPSDIIITLPLIQTFGTGIFLIGLGALVLYFLLK